MMRRTIMGCLAIVFCVLMTLPVMAAESALSLVPDGALGFVVIRDVASTSEKIGKVVEQFDSEMPPLLATFKAQIALNDGLDDQGDVLLALMPGEDQPQPLLALPVTDYDALIKQLDGDPAKEITEVSMAGQDLLVAHKGDYAVFVDSDSRATLRKLLSSEAKAQAAEHPLKDWIAENDVTIVVLPAGLKLGVEMGSEGLDEARAGFEQMAEQFGEGQSGMEQVVAMFDMYSKGLKFLGGEVQSAAIGLAIDDAGNLKVGGRARLAPNGELAKVASSSGPVLKQPLSGIPNVPFVGCASMHWDPEWGETMMAWSVEMMKLSGSMYGFQNADDDQMKELIDASKSLVKNLTSMSMYLLPGEADAPVVSDMYYVIKVADSSKYLKDYEKYIKTWNDVVAGGPVPMQYETEMIKIEDRDALELKMDVAAMIAAQGGGDPQMQAMMQQMMQEMMAKMFGPDGKITIYLVVADDNTVFGGVGSKEQIVAALKALGDDSNGTLSSNSDVQTTAALLSKDATMVGYLSPQGLAAWFTRMMGAMVPVGMPAMPEFPNTPPIGFSTRFAKEAVEVEMVVPAATIKGLGEFVEEAQQAFGP